MIEKAGTEENDEAVQERLNVNDKEYFLNPNEDSEYSEDDYLSKASLDDVSMRPEDGSDDIGDVDMPGFGNMTWSQFSDLSIDDLADIFFAEVEDATKFYSYYSFIKGFSVRIKRKDKSKADKDKVRCLEMVCWKEGYCTPSVPVIKHTENDGKKNENNGKKKLDNKRGYRYTRCGCMADFKCVFDKDNGYYGVKDNKCVFDKDNGRWHKNHHAPQSS